MTNKDIAGLLKLTASLMQLHDENQFKIRTFSNAVFNIEKQEESLLEKNLEELEALDGIGKGLAKSIMEIKQKRTFSTLEELVKKTPEGVLDMINLKGIGPKKVRTVWKELNIEDTDQLLEACKKGQIAKLKGFGTKTQESLIENLEYLISQRGRMLYADVEKHAEQLIDDLRKAFPNVRIEPTGAMRRKMEIIESVELITDSTAITPIKKYLEQLETVKINDRESGPFSLRGQFSDFTMRWRIRFTDPSKFHKNLMITTGSGSHLSKVQKEGISLSEYLHQNNIESEDAAYSDLGFPYIIPEMREGSFEIKYAEDNIRIAPLDIKDIKGPFHNHSTYSDGKNSIAELAKYCIDQGYEYLGLSDHSKSAFYANGLQEFHIKKQQEEIDKLNKDLHPFKIFKGIESDILSDGSLDYEPEFLASFDFIVASIHSNLNMDKTKATQRLTKAIENPYTTMLGHPTGRLLLRRKGYPVDHRKIIDACAANDVIIEINANPWRLDIDWRYVNYAMEKGVVLSINPDAHELQGFEDMKYGVFMGRKGGLTKEMTFNAWSLDKVEKYLTDRNSRI